MGVELRLCKVIFWARPAWGATVPGGRGNVVCGIRGDLVMWGGYGPQLGICFRSRDKRKRQLYTNCVRALFRTQDFLPDPCRPNSGAFGARNLGQVCGSLCLGKPQFYNLARFLVSIWKSAFGFIDALIRSLRLKNESAKLSITWCSSAPNY